MPLIMEDPHRHFLQSFMSRGILDGREVKELYRQVCEKYNRQFDIMELAKFVLTINNNIKPYHMEIKKGIGEHDETNFYCLVNLKEDDITRMARNFSQVEFEYFKKIMEEVVCSGSQGCVSSTEALNLVEWLGGRLKKNDAQALIERLTSERWLVEDADGQILLTPRTIMEFDHYIKTQFPDDCVFCELCKKLVIRGQNCRVCSVRLHKHCAKKFFKPDSAKCPKCKEEWTHDLSGKKKATDERNDVSRESESSSSGRETRRSARR